MAGPVCQNKNRVEKVSSIINNKIKNVYKKGDRGIEDGKKTVSKKTKQAIKLVQEKKQELEKKYKNMRWRTLRPDVTLVAETLIFILFLILLIKIIPVITATVKPGFTKEQFEYAKTLPSSSIDLETAASVKLELKAFQDYGEFFKFDPYDKEFSGAYELERLNTILPILTFIMQFVLPPFIVAYGFWFIAHYWPHVFRAGWGMAFEVLYPYFTKKFQRKFGCKWYIRMVTGWGCGGVSFNRYFMPWKRKYVDIPVWDERFRYLRRYYWARRVYIEIPYRKYIELPFQRLKINLQYAKKLYIERAFSVFMRKLAGSYNPYYTQPRDELYLKVLRNNRNLAAAYAKIKQTKAQLEGKPYVSITPSGNKCKCPATKTPLKSLKNKIKDIGKFGAEIKSELDRMIEETNNIYDTINNVKLPDPTKCKTYDDVIYNRKPIAMWTLIVLVSSIICILIYSSYAGVPAWIAKILRPTSLFVSNTVRVINDGNRKVTWLFMYLGFIGLILVSLLVL